MFSEAFPIFGEVEVYVASRRALDLQDASAQKFIISLDFKDGLLQLPCLPTLEHMQLYSYALACCHVPKEDCHTYGLILRLRIQKRIQTHAIIAIATTRQSANVVFAVC